MVRTVYYQGTTRLIVRDRGNARYQLVIAIRGVRARTRPLAADYQVRHWRAS